MHFEVVGKDGAALQRYYHDLFGWNFDTNNPTGYGFVAREESGIAVGVGSAQDGSAGHVTGYVNVPDINAALAKAESLGGRTIMPRFSPAPETWLALVADPEGHVLGLNEA